MTRGGSTIRHGIVLAAGFGSRLRPLTARVAKPCVPVGGQPLLHYVLDDLGHLGVEQVAVNASWRAADVAALLGERVGAAPETELVTEIEPLGTGGGARGCVDRLGLAPNTPVLLVNGDVVLARSDLRQLMAAAAPDQATLLTTDAGSVPESARKVRVHNGDVRAIDGVGPAASEREACVAYACALVAPASWLQELPTVGCLKEQGFWRWLRDERPIRELRAAGTWLDIGTVGSYLAAHEAWLDGSWGPAGTSEDGVARRSAQTAWIHPSARVHPSARIVAPSWVAEGVQVQAHATVGPYAFIDRGAVIGERVAIHHSVVWPNVCVREDAAHVVRIPDTSG